jgi:hypothetical protein
LFWIYLESVAVRLAGDAFIAIAVAGKPDCYGAVLSLRFVVLAHAAIIPASGEGID